MGRASTPAPANDAPRRARPAPRAARPPAPPGGSAVGAPASAELQYQLLADQTSDAVFILDGSTLQIADANPGAAALTGYPRRELLGKSVSALIPAPERRAELARIAAASTRLPQFSDGRLRRQDGTVVPVEVRQQRLADGRILGVLRRVGQWQLAATHLHEMLGGIELLAATLDEAGLISYVNPALSALSGWTAAELIGQPAFELLQVGSEDGPGHLLEGLAGATLHRPLTAQLRTRWGELRPVTVSASPLRDGGGRTVGTALLGQDAAADASCFSALQAQLRERAEVAAALASLQPGASAQATMSSISSALCRLSGVDISCVVVFDGEDGATVQVYAANTTVAAETGTKLPASRAAYLLQRAQQGAWSEPWQARQVDGAWGSAISAAGIHSASYAPIRRGDDVLGVLVVVSVDGEPEGAHPQSSYLPMISEFGAAASALLAEQLWHDRVAAQGRRLITEILDAEGLTPYFQPLVDLGTGVILGYEALTRFADGEPPDRRFATAWEVGVGAELEFAALEAAILAAHHLPKDAWLNLNVSPRLLDQTARLRELIARAGRPVVVEITEHEVITDYRAVREALSRLQGVRTAVDDAGAGTANFAHVIELQPDFVKLDIGLVRGIDRDVARQAMVVAMRHFAKATGCQLIAEGVETKAEAETVLALGADLGQGFWYGRPAPVGAEAPEPLATAGRPAPTAGSPNGGGLSSRAAAP